jgi:hypothetical protein
MRSNPEIAVEKADIRLANSIRHMCYLQGAKLLMAFLVNHVYTRPSPLIESIYISLFVARSD